MEPLKARVRKVLCKHLRSNCLLYLLPAIKLLTLIGYNSYLAIFLS